MDKQDQNGLDELAHSANTIHGVLRTGKAISNIAKGAAAGGPYGAAIAGALAAQKHIGAIPMRKSCFAEIIQRLVKRKS